MVEAFPSIICQAKFLWLEKFGNNNFQTTTREKHGTQLTASKKKEKKKREGRRERGKRGLLEGGLLFREQLHTPCYRNHSWENKESRP